MGLDFLVLFLYRSTSLGRSDSIHSRIICEIGILNLFEAASKFPCISGVEVNEVLMV